jgi:hypothetical protein
MLWETKYAMPYLVIHIVPTGSIGIIRSANEIRSLVMILLYLVCSRAIVGMLLQSTGISIIVLRYVCGVGL